MLSEIVHKSSEYKRKFIKVIILSFIGLLSVGYAFFEHLWVSTIFTPVSLYIISFVYGIHYRNVKDEKKHTVIAVLIIFVSFDMRFIAKLWFDDTILYDRIIVPYTHMIAACAIFYLFERIFVKRKVPKIVQLCSDMSFEIYLYHYMFTVGPISLFCYTNHWFTDCVLVTSVVFLISLFIKKFPEIIQKMMHKLIGEKSL